jgi:hypothetical protein
MKIIITESQFEDAVIRYVKKSFKNEIVDVYFSGKMLEIILPGEESFKRENKIKVQLYDELKNVFSKSFPIQVHFEQKFYGNVQFDGDEESGYDVTFTKELDNGEMFELTGRMEEYNSGRDIEYSFEPSDNNNEDYYDDNWDVIEQFIINKFYYR